MKEENITFILDMIFKEKDSCTLPELYDAARKYMENHKYTYIDISGDEVDYYLYNYVDEYYYDSKKNTVYKQESAICKFCGTKHRKYPDIDKFNAIIAANKGYGEKDIHDAFMAGFNRGVYAATLIKGEPIEGEYPTCEQYIEKLKNERSNERSC
jgi:hypothetical protein